MQFLSILLFCVSCTAALIPHYIKPCARSDPNFNACALQHATENWKELVKGDRKNDIQPFDPMNILEVRLDHNGFHLISKDIEVKGLKELALTRTDYDFKNKKFAIMGKTPRLDMVGKYEVTGKLLILPINGKGIVNCTLIGEEIEIEGSFSFETISGKTYLNTIKPVIRMMPKRMYLSFTNLFNGNKVLEDQMNKFLDDNWKEVHAELTKPGTEALAQILSAILNKLHKTSPYEEMFPENLP